jgi:hypothetical protein
MTDLVGHIYRLGASQMHLRCCMHGSNGWLRWLSEPPARRRPPAGRAAAAARRRASAAVMATAVTKCSSSSSSVAPGAGGQSHQQYIVIDDDDEDASSPSTAPSSAAPTPVRGGDLVPQLLRMFHQITAAQAETVLTVRVATHAIAIPARS